MRYPTEQADRPRLAVWLLTLFLIVQPATAQSEAEEVVRTVETFFQALSLPDTVALGRVLLRDGQFYSVAEGPDGPVARVSPHENIFGQVAGAAGRFLERGWNPSVSVHGQIAVLSVPYDFHIDRQFSHCGTDIFNLIRLEGRWRISGVTYTVEREGCAESPLGSPFSYQGVRRSLPTGASGISTTGLVLSYDMATLLDDGRLRDFSDAGNHGVLEVPLTQEEGPSGPAKRFDEVTDRVYIPENPTLELDGPLTVALWLRVRELGIHQHILACDDKFALWVTPENRIRFSDSRGHGADTSAPIAGDEWFSLVAVYDGQPGSTVTASNPLFYINGEAVQGTLVNRGGEPVWTPSDLYPSDACYAGFESHQGLESHVNLPFVGDTDDMMLFSRALGPAEAKVHATLR